MTKTNTINKTQTALSIDCQPGITNRTRKKAAQNETFAHTAGVPVICYQNIVSSSYLNKS